jgi:protein kinase C substrate 80K-H
MAVLEAVRGWEEHVGLPHINEVNKEEGSTEEEKKEDEKKEEPLEEGMWDADKLQNQLNGLLNTDYTSLLLEHDEYSRTSGDEEESLSKSKFSILSDYSSLHLSVYDIASYLPDFALEYYDQLKEGLVALLETLHVIPAADKTPCMSPPR